ncbi:MAG: hypothetical protein HC846_08730 [Blastocatellia bacterium]|nr:hypothetical protein [Blastocatellia bacterium]
MNFTTNEMDTKKEYCLIVEGSYLDESDASDALREPFIDEYCESTGSFRVHNFNEIEVAGGIALGDLAVSMIEDEIFKITSNNATRRISEQKGKMIADALRRHDMFEEIRIEPLE